MPLGATLASGKKALRPETLAIVPSWVQLMPSSETAPLTTPCLPLKSHQTT